MSYSPKSPEELREFNLRLAAENESLRRINTELLEALEGVLEVSETLKRPLNPAELRTVRAAIARARGES